MGSEERARSKLLWWVGILFFFLLLLRLPLPLFGRLPCRRPLLSPSFPRLLSFRWVPCICNSAWSPFPLFPYSLPSMLDEMLWISCRSPSSGLIWSDLLYGGIYCRRVEIVFWTKVQRWIKLAGYAALAFEPANVHCSKERKLLKTLTLEAGLILDRIFCGEKRVWCGVGWHCRVSGGRLFLAPRCSAVPEGRQLASHHCCFLTSHIHQRNKIVDYY